MVKTADITLVGAARGEHEDDGGQFQLLLLLLLLCQEGGKVRNNNIDWLCIDTKRVFPVIFSQIGRSPI